MLSRPQCLDGDKGTEERECVAGDSGKRKCQWFGLTAMLGAKMVGCEGHLVKRPTRDFNSRHEFRVV